MTIEFELDGSLTKRACSPDLSLYELIYPDTGAAGTCPNGECLRCSLLLNDRVVLACRTPAFRANNGRVRTFAGYKTTQEYADIKRVLTRIGLDACAEEVGFVFLIEQILQEHAAPSEEDAANASRYLTDRCSDRESFTRAVRLTAGLRRRHTGERRRT